MFGQRFTADGIAEGSEFQVDTTGIRHMQPSMAAMADGDFVVVWFNDTNAQLQSENSIFGQRFASDGSRVGDQFKVSTSEPNNNLHIRALPDGGFIVSYDSHYSASGEPVRAYLQQFLAPSSVLSARIKTNADASDTIGIIDNGISFINTKRSSLGATINRLEYAADNLTDIAQNTDAARSRILDTDYALETTELARTQIIQQAATAMLTQANQQGQQILELLKAMDY